MHTCEPADPATKGGSESTVKLAKADLVPTEVNLFPAYDSFADIEDAWTPMTSHRRGGPGGRQLA